MGRIHLLECYNFKSYKDLQVIGPFFDFQAVIGPNGSGNSTVPLLLFTLPGKSNLMDAISFVLGVRTGQLRGNNLQELIYKGPEDTPAADSAYVKMTFVDDNDKEFIFQRTIKREGKDSKYTINGKKISAEDYDKRLKDFGILVKAKNFLVFQVTPHFSSFRLIYNRETSRHWHPSHLKISQLCLNKYLVPQSFEMNTKNWLL